jgi:hypothetical protein
MNVHEPAYAKANSRRLEKLDTATALALLGSAAFGRVVFTQNALPAIRPAASAGASSSPVRREPLTTRPASLASNKPFTLGSINP